MIISDAILTCQLRIAREYSYLIFIAAENRKRVEGFCEGMYMADPKVKIYVDYITVISPSEVIKQHLDR